MSGLLKVFVKLRRPEPRSELALSSRSLVTFAGYGSVDPVVNTDLGYGCLDAFLEGDTYLHSWEMFARIIDHPDCQDIVVDVGMPVRHRDCKWNCR